MKKSIFEISQDGLMYKSFPRQCLLVDEFTGSCNLAKYETDPATPAVCLNEDWEKCSVTSKEDLIIGFHKIRNFPIPEFIDRYSTERLGKFLSIYNRWLINKEERAFFTLLEQVQEVDNCFLIEEDDLTIKSINRAFSEIEQHDLVVSKVMMHPIRISDILSFGADFSDLGVGFKYEDLNKERYHGRVGYLYTANIIVSTNCPIDDIFFSASPETAGVYSVKDNRTSAEAGMAIINTYAMKKLKAPFHSYLYNRPLRKKTFA